MYLRIAMTLALTLVNSVAAETVLVREGKAESTIVVPEDASAAVRRAATELARYLLQISGAEVDVLTDGAADGGACIHVGNTEAVQEAFDASTWKNPETIAIRTVGRNVLICGGSDRATLFAVYRFLEQCLDCRWLTFTTDYVPGSTTIAVDDIDYVKTPAFDLRLFKARGEDAVAWGLKVGLNGLYQPADGDATAKGYAFPEALNATHTWVTVIPAKKYFDEHPEWFPLLNGARAPSQLHNAQLCVTAEGLADAFAKNIIAIFDGEPERQITSISPNDGYGWCECEACEALDDKLCGGRTTQQGLAKARPFRGDRVFWFANEVARRVAAKYPDKMLLVLAYVNYAEPPDTIRPLPNVVPWLCHYAPADYAKPINDPASEPNRQFNTLLRPWAERAPHLLFYAYVSKSMWWELPRPVLRNFAADVKYLHELGIHRYYAQSPLSNWVLDGPLYYVLAKSLWDPAEDPRVLARDWIDHMFGDAAPEMAAYYDAVDAAVRETGQAYSDNPPRDVPGLFHLSHLDRAREALDAALNKGEDEIVRERVEQVRDVFLYGYYMIQAFEVLEIAKETGEPEDFAKVRTLGQKALGFNTVPKARTFLASACAYAEIGGIMVRGFGEPEERGGRTCWNSDETGLGDGRSGWASFHIRVPDPTTPARLEMEVWGESQLTSIVVHNGKGDWQSVAPGRKLSGEPKWETLVFEIPPKLMQAGKAVQEVGFGGGDSQVWVAAIRVSTKED